VTAEFGIVEPVPGVDVRVGAGIASPCSSKAGGNNERDHRPD